MRKFALVAVVLLIGGIQSGWAASFNCGPYISRGKCPEALICSESRLSRLDDTLAALYFTARSKMQQGLLTGFRDYQREWLAKRNGCGCNYQCLKSEYDTQIEGLRKTLDGLR
ncbi:MAG: lysozyme inhibitor LprI family protein [Rhodomicrobium sp.]